MSFRKIDKKEFPDIVTKSFMFDVYMKSGIPEKVIRDTINYYVTVLGGNVRKRILHDLIVIYCIRIFDLPNDIKLSEKLKNKIKILKE